MHVSEGRNVNPLGTWKAGYTLTLTREDSEHRVNSYVIRHMSLLKRLDWTGTRRTWMRRAPPRSRSLLVVEERLVRSL